MSIGTLVLAIKVGNVIIIPTIGGRDEWVEFLDGNPIYWTVFGFPITSNVLTSLGFTALTSLAAVAIPFFSASSNDAIPTAVPVAQMLS